MNSLRNDPYCSFGLVQLVVLLAATTLGLLGPAPANAAGLLLTCDVGGARLEIYNEKTHQWVASGTLPRLITGQQYSYHLVRVNADGYQQLEQGFELRNPGTTHTNIVLEPVITDAESLPLFAFGGQVTNRLGKPVPDGSYIALVRNLSTYVSGANQGQKTQDINPVEQGYFTLTLADLGNNRAVATGDKIFVGIFNPTKSRCYAFTSVTVKSDDINNGYIQVDLKVR